ncbi:MAG: FAD-binding oxidoreductase [Acidimicrobiales bacterium]|nr:FAD-binding oxidoreductase [Acidimicrobiales bacterium]
MTELQAEYDVVIVGGAVMGSSVAHFLTSNPDFDGSVLVVERDPSYQRSSTTLSGSAIRHQFSNEINVKISQFGSEFIKSFADHCSVDGEAPDLSFHENGYLFLIDEERKDTLVANWNTQTSLGSDISLLTPERIAQRWPWINTDGIAAGSLGETGEGWFDSYGLMQGFRQKARSNGAVYATDEVVGLVRDHDRIDAVRLASGATVRCRTLVNAAGPRARLVCAMAGLDVPVVPRKRYMFVFDSRTRLPDPAPAVIDPTGLFVRPEGQFYLCTLEPQPDPDADFDDFTVWRDQFEEIIWPLLAQRIPAFEAVKVVNSWCGHYAFNTLDHNAVVGPHTEVENFLFCNGFSGHGLQQSPAVGRAISELITYGRYETLDLAPLGYRRIETGTPFLETLVI